MTLLKGPDVENVTEQILSNVVRPGLRRLPGNSDGLPW